MLGRAVRAPVRTTKNALKTTLCKSLLTFRELETILYRIEAVINARPLSAECDHLNDARPISPDDFLRKSTPDTSDMKDAATGVSLTEAGVAGSFLGDRWRHREQVLAHLWRRWQREYIRELRAIQRQDAKGPDVGNLVLIGDSPATSIALWRTGRIAQLQIGRDGLPRSASVQLSGGTEVSRPLQ